MAKLKKVSDLVLVEKDGEQIEVHPGTLENHKQLGWKVVEQQPARLSPEPEPENDDE